MWILWSKLSYSLHNRFYRVSAILFTASDVLAAFRVINILPETPYFDVPCYFLAIMFYAESAFSCEEKEVVTIVDVLDINRRLRKQKLYYCMYGPWAMNLSARRYYRQTSGYHLAYDVTQRDQICALLTKRLGFKLRFTIYPNTIGPGLMIYHTGDFVHVGGNVRIGKNCTLLPGVVFSSKTAEDKVVVGDNCRFGLGVRIFGSVKIGNNVVIGANAVVTKDIPDNCIAVGIPARVIK